MTTPKIYSAALAAACLLASGPSAFAQDFGRLTIETEIELGIDSVIKSDTAGDELTDTYGVVDVGLTFALTERVSFFAALTLESVTDATADRAFEDMGLYIGEIGLAFELGNFDIAVGKISPVFGTAWDAAPGFYGTALAEDYELSEMIGASVETDVGGGTLSFALFYADDTALSRSWGTDRGRNTTAAGGAGNTGKLNNVALQWSKAIGDTTLTFGARHLSAGVGDVGNENGLSIGVTHAVNETFEIIGEVAAFNGYGGTADDATYATFGASFGNGPITYSGAVSYRDLTSTGTTSMVTVGLDYEFDSGVTIGTGIAFTRDAGVDSQALGVNIVIPIGG